MNHLTWMLMPYAREVFVVPAYYCGIVPMVASPGGSAVTRRAARIPWRPKPSEIGDSSGEREEHHGGVRETRPDPDAPRITEYLLQVTDRNGHMCILAL